MRRYSCISQFSRARGKVYEKLREVQVVSSHSWSVVRAVSTAVKWPEIHPHQFICIASCTYRNLFSHSQVPFSVEHKSKIIAVGEWVKILHNIFNCSLCCYIAVPPPAFPGQVGVRKNGGHCEWSLCEIFSILWNTFFYVTSTHESCSNVRNGQIKWRRGSKTHKIDSKERHCRKIGW